MRRDTAYTAADRLAEVCMKFHTVIFTLLWATDTPRQCAHALGAQNKELSGNHTGQTYYLPYRPDLLRRDEVYVSIRDKQSRIVILLLYKGQLRKICDPPPSDKSNFCLVYQLILTRVVTLKGEVGREEETCCILTSRQIGMTLPNIEPTPSRQQIVSLPTALFRQSTIYEESFRLRQFLGLAFSSGTSLRPAVKLQYPQPEIKIVGTYASATRWRKFDTKNAEYKRNPS
ncbi:hypothetical protein EVAR_46031_1 [Eumeta japonica]|uniref:Uncharacterized protein n=1 Tax=Eumeta variegata TaxID=151549 RepID=A0A4C1XG86_EUMVA|nr:hypothetical protein EVAR_46031_1 [Eumeta japonica]